MTYERPVYVVIPFGSADDPATDADLTGVVKALRPFYAYAVTDRHLCDQLSRHLVTAGALQRGQG